MANKRQLKKRIQYVCGDLAADILLASYMTDKIARNDVDSILTEIAALQDEAIGKVSFAFDKVVKDFPSAQAYNKARATYNAEAFATLRKEFSEKAALIVKKMNEVVPADIRKAVSD